MGFAAVARVTDGRWIACGVRDDIGFGLKPGAELQVETTICQEVRRTNEAVVIEQVASDPVYCGHPTPAMYGFQSYVSVPIKHSDGRFFGTLCAIDPRPAKVDTPETRGMFKLFAELIAFHLDASDRLASSEASLVGEREAAELREQFIAVLGHDLRNPLNSFDAGLALLSRTPLNARAAGIVTLMQGSVVRMGALIGSVLDFARGRLGGGLTLQRESEALEPVLDQIVAELRATAPDRDIDVRFAVADRVDCDRNRVGQLFSNLLGNALTHGATDMPVYVRGDTGDGRFVLSVTNFGDPIPPAAMERLFQPFSRGTLRTYQQGLGLGLYIASEIARAHGGTLQVASANNQTCFTFEMPIATP